MFFNETNKTAKDRNTLFHTFDFSLDLSLLRFRRKKKKIKKTHTHKLTKMVNGT